MDTIEYNITEFIRKVTANLNRQLLSEEVADLNNLILDLGIKHIDGFTLTLLYLPPVERDLDIEKYIADPSNLIVNFNATHSWFFLLLKEYAQSIKDLDELEELKQNLKIVIKGIKTLLYTIIDDIDLLKISSKKKKELFKLFQNEIVNTLYVHAQDLDMETLEDMFRRISQHIGSSHITKDAFPLIKFIKSISNEENETIIRHLTLQLNSLKIILPESIEQFKLLIKHKGRVESPIIWRLKDWQLYWLLYFLKETKFIELVSNQDLFNYICHNFIGDQKQEFNRKEIMSHVSRSKTHIKGKIAGQYLNYYNTLQDAFTTYKTTFHHLSF